MTNILSRFNNRFPCDEFPAGMFYDFEYALRFELGGEDNSVRRPIKRFLQAFDRANQIAQHLFKKSDTLWLLCSSFNGELLKKKRLKIFKYCGLSKSKFSYLGATAQNDSEHIALFDEDLYLHWDAAKIKSLEQLTEILWLALGAEIVFRPAIPNKYQMNIYIADFEKSIALCPYDDRGVDIVSLDKENLIGLYNTYKSWLLDYDIDRMQRIFEERH